VGVPKAGRPGFHVDVRGEGAVADRRAGFASCVSVIAARHSAWLSVIAPATVIGAMAPISVKGVTIDKLPGAREVDQPLRHRHVERAGAVGVDDRVGMDAPLRELLLRQAARDPQHLEIVERLRRAAREEERKLVGQRHLARGGEVVAQMGGDVLRLDRGRHHLEDVEMVREAGVIAEILARAGAAAAFEIGRVRRARAGLEGERAKLQHHVAMRRAGAAMDRFRRGRQRRLDHLAPEIDHRRPRPARRRRRRSRAPRAAARSIPSSSSISSAVSCMFAASSSEKTDMTGKGLRNWR
jgi:hypothetical protein